MSFVSLLPWWLLALIGAALIIFCLYLAVRRRPERRAWFRRGAMVLLLTLAFLRPGVGGVDASSAASQLDVFFVVDTTSSVVAQDFGTGEPRLSGVKADLKAIAAKLPGASFSLIGFAQEAKVLVPLTSDGNALTNSIDGLSPEVTAYSRGSSVTVAAKSLAARLAAAKKSRPDRARLVYYFGDGEQTAASTPEPFHLADGLVSGGAVLGYGTAAGGTMKINSGLGQGLGPGYIQDYARGADAVSKIDENMLRAIAGQLGVGYVHRNAGEGIDPALAGVQPGALRIDGQSPVRAQFELYWIFGLGILALAAWELFALTRQMRRLMPSSMDKSQKPKEPQKPQNTGAAS